MVGLDQGPRGAVEAARYRVDVCQWSEMNDTIVIRDQVLAEVLGPNGVIKRKLHWNAGPLFA